MINDDRMLLHQMSGIFIPNKMSFCRIIFAFAWFGAVAVVVVVICCCGGDGGGVVRFGVVTQKLRET